MLVIIDFILISFVNIKIGMLKFFAKISVKMRKEYQVMASFRKNILTMVSQCSDMDMTDIEHSRLLDRIVENAPQSRSASIFDEDDNPQVFTLEKYFKMFGLEDLSEELF